MKKLLPLLMLSATVGCEEIPSAQIIPCAPLDEFRQVSNVLERRCGTLDCHGEYARPLRIYGQNGLRLATPEELDPAIAQENDTVAGGKGTTDDEVELNWRSACGIEPEKSAQVLAGQIPPEDLMLMRKPLHLERHKGEQLFISGGDAGAVCLGCWLRGLLVDPGEDVQCVDVVKNCQDAVASGTL